MGAAFEGQLSPLAVAQLRAGDIIAVQTLDRFASWAIMYLSQAEISHVAVYLGDGRIGHSSPPDGVKTEPLEALYSMNVRLLPCIWNIPDAKRPEVVEEIERTQMGRPYGWGIVATKGLRILTGRDWHRFRWKFFADIAVLAAVVDVSLVFTAGHPVLVWPTAAYLTVIVGNAFYHHYRPLRYDETSGVPGDVLAMVRHCEGAFIFDAMAIRKEVEEHREKRV